MQYLLCMSVILFVGLDASSDCPDHCVCNAPDLECYKTLPSFIPENVSSVTALEVPLVPYMNFTYTDWHSVTYLSLSLGNVNKTRRICRRLQDYEFIGLMNLQHLKVLCHCGLSVNKKTFYGLTNVSVLNLSSNIVDSLTFDIVAGLKGEDILPNISELYLSNITWWHHPTSSLSLSLDNLHIAMENKPLQVLDLSGTKVRFYIRVDPTPPSLLPQLHTLNISRSGKAVFSLSYIYSFYTQKQEAVFSNLQVLDASYPYFPKSQSECEKSPDYYWQFCKTGQHTTYFLPPNLTELYIPNILASQIPELRGKFNSTHLCITTKIFSTNKTICVGGYFRNLEKLDISNNAFTYIQPELINPLKSLRHIDFGNNTLGHSLNNAKYARTFFHALNSTETLLLPYNNITFLPSKTLKHNLKLKTLDLSYNRLTTVGFGLNYLSELRMLDLSHNELATVNFGPIYRLDLSHNRLTSVDSGLSHLNELRILDLSFNGLTSVNLGIRGIRRPLELLDLSYNRIVSVDSSDCELIKGLRFNPHASNTSMSHNNSKRGLKLEGNPITCSCENLCLFKFLQDQNKTLTCNDTRQNSDFLHVKHLEYSCRKGVAIALFSIDGISTVIILAVMVPVLLRMHRQRMTEKERKKLKELIERTIEKGIERQTEGENDHVAFLSYSGDDQSFVLNKVFPNLDEGLKGILKVEQRCVGTGAHDMVPGHPLQREIIKCIEKASVVIFFVTKSFCKQRYCEIEFETAVHIKKPIILMMYGKVSRRCMPAVLRTHFESYVRVHWMIENGIATMMPSWDSLCPNIFKLIGEQENPAPDDDSESDDNDDVNAGGNTGNVVASSQKDDKKKSDKERDAKAEADSANRHHANDDYAASSLDRGVIKIGSNEEKSPGKTLTVVADVHAPNGNDICNTNSISDSSRQKSRDDNGHEVCNGEKNIRGGRFDSGDVISGDMGVSGNMFTFDKHPNVLRSDKHGNPNSNFGVDNFKRHNNGLGEKYDKENSIDGYKDANGMIGKKFDSYHPSWEGSTGIVRKFGADKFETGNPYRGKNCDNGNSTGVHICRSGDDIKCDMCDVHHLIRGKRYENGNSVGIHRCGNGENVMCDMCDVLHLIRGDKDESGYNFGVDKKTSGSHIRDERYDIGNTVGSHTCGNGENEKCDMCDVLRLIRFDKNESGYNFGMDKAVNGRHIRDKRYDSANTVGIHTCGNGENEKCDMCEVLRLIRSDNDEIGYNFGVNKTASGSHIRDERYDIGNTVSIHTCHYGEDKQCDMCDVLRLIRSDKNESGYNFGVDKTASGNQSRAERYDSNHTVGIHTCGSGENVQCDMCDVLHLIRFDKNESKNFGSDKIAFGNQIKGERSVSCNTTGVHTCGNGENLQCDLCDILRLIKVDKNKSKNSGLENLGKFKNDKCESGNVNMSDTNAGGNNILDDRCDSCNESQRNMYKCSKNTNEDSNEYGYMVKRRIRDDTSDHGNHLSNRYDAIGYGIIDKDNEIKAESCYSGSEVMDERSDKDNNFDIDVHICYGENKENENCDNKNNIGIDKTDSGNYNFDDKLEANDNRQANDFNNVNTVENVDSTANASTCKIDIETHGDIIPHISKEGDNSGDCSVSDNKDIECHHGSDSVDQIKESNDPGDNEKSTLLQKLQPKCHVM